MQVLVRSFLHTPDATFSEEFIFSTPDATFSEEFIFSTPDTSKE